MLGPPGAARTVSALLLGGLLVRRAACGQQPPAAYRAADESGLSGTMARMNTQEKFQQTCIDSNCPESKARWLQCNPLGGGGVGGGGANWFNLLDNERLGVRGMRMRDGPKGMTCGAGEVSFGRPCPDNGTSPSFPSQVTRAATWDTALEEEIGKAIGEIAAALDVHAALLPTINVLPWLNWGRAQESYGEDPFFSGKMGAAVVRGVQREGKVMATPKHFLANNIENTRWWVSAEFDDKTLHEVYLKAWAILVNESAPELVMTSYNRVQGEWANSSPKFLAILREKLGFDGSVMTDWFATWEFIMSGILLGKSSAPNFGQKNFVPAGSLYKSGVDMEMPFCSKNTNAVSQMQRCADGAQEACEVRNALDDSVERLLRSKSRYGLLGAPMRNHTSSPAIEWDNGKYDTLILRAAQEGIVLLKNDGDVLPKPASEVRSVVVLGTPEELELGDHGSSMVRPSGPLVNILKGLESKYHGSKVEFLQGLGGTDNATAVRDADLVVIDVGFNASFEGEFLPPVTGGDRKYLGLHQWDIDLILQAAALNPNVVVAITAGAAVTVEEIADAVPAILWLGYPGPLGGTAFADILSGDVNPSGRMPFATPKRAEDFLPAGIDLAPWASENAAPPYPYSHGFKHMWGTGVEPRFPFGWGLSYTTFSHSGHAAELDAARESVFTRVVVRNAGATSGRETVQVYASCPECRVQRQPVSLVGFTKLRLEPGQEQALTIEVPLRELATYSAADGLWHLEAGGYVFWVGRCADRAALQATRVNVGTGRTFEYPGAAARARAGRARADCGAPGGAQCEAEPEPALISSFALPDAWSLDPAFVVRRALMYPVLATAAAGILALAVLGGLAVGCWRLCRRLRGACGRAPGKQKAA